MAILNVNAWTMSWDSQESRWNFEYFTLLDTLTKPQWEAAMKGWGLAWFWYDETMLVLCPDASIAATAKEVVNTCETCVIYWLNEDQQ